MRIPGRVLIRLTPSAPASSQALATAAISAAVGDNFKMMGFFVTARTAFVTSAADLGSAPKAAPPPWTLGQEMLTSNQPTCSCASNFSQTSAYSATEKPLILAMTFL